MIANLAIYGWPLVALVLIKTMDRTSGLIWSMLAGFLLLPRGIGLDLPLLPEINKGLVASLPVGIYLALDMGLKSRETPLYGQGVTLPGLLPKNGVGRTCILMLLGGSVITVLLNGDRLIYGFRSLPGLAVYDALSFLMNTMVSLLPFFLARKYLAHPDAHRRLLWIFMIAAVIYSIPTLYEVRMSPQLNKMVYGFFPHDWRQHLRAGGYRPVVFLNHGLVLGLFIACSLLATLAYMRTAQTGSKKTLYIGIALWLAITLVLAKTLGPLMITIVLAPFLLLMRVPTQLLMASIVAGFVLTYPIMRGADIVPVDRFITFVEGIDVGRAGSAKFRFDNEDILLEKANERPLFGWGGWGRARVYDEEGTDISVTDGYWVIIIGEGGWLGYLGQFGLLTSGILLLALRRRKYEVGAATSGLCIVLSANLIDLLPNAAMTPLTLIMAGALMGRVELGALGAVADQTSRPVPKGRMRHSRARTPQPDPNGGMDEVVVAHAAPTHTAPNGKLGYSRQRTTINRLNKGPS